MRTKVLSIVAALCVIAPAAAIAQVPTQLRSDYTRAYNEVRSLPAEYPAGCNLLLHRCADERIPTIAAVKRSITVLDDEIAAYQATQVPQSAGSQGQGSQDAAPASSSGSAGDGFAQCVAFHESSNDPTYNDGTYHGLYNFDQQTWEAAGGTAYAPSADQASSADQTRVFQSYYSGHPSAWPQTGPMCGGGG